MLSDERWQLKLNIGIWYFLHFDAKQYFSMDELCNEILKNGLASELKAGGIQKENRMEFLKKKGKFAPGMQILG